MKKMPKYTSIYKTFPELKPKKQSKLIENLELAFGLMVVAFLLVCVFCCGVLSERYIFS